MKIKLPNGWKVKKLEEVCEVSSSNLALKDVKDLDGKYPIYGASGIVAWADFYHKEDEVLGVVKDGAGFGRVFILPPKSSVIGTLNYLKNLENANLKYLYYFLKTIDFSQYVFGAAIPHIYFKNYKNEQIPLPSLEEQRKIVKILDEKFASIDESIRLVKDDLLSLDELWQSVLNDSFNPLKSKLDNDTYTLPPTWKWEKLGDICEKTKNANLKDFNDDISYIDISSIDNKNFMILDYKKINNTQAPSRAKRQVKFGDILYATTRPNLKNIAMVNQEYYNPIASTGFCIIRAKKDVKKYIFYFLLSDYVTDFVARFIKGAQYPAVSDKDIFNIQIPLPPLKEQEHIAKELESKAKTIKELKELYTKRLKDYEELKESLLDLAFKGGL